MKSDGDGVGGGDRGLVGSGGNSVGVGIVHSSQGAHAAGGAEGGAPIVRRGGEDGDERQTIARALMQLVVPRAVAMAVRMEMMTWRRNFQVSFFESLIISSVRDKG